MYSWSALLPLAKALHTASLLYYVPLSHYFYFFIFDIIIYRRTELPLIMHSFYAFWLCILITSLIMPRTSQLIVLNSLPTIIILTVESHYRRCLAESDDTFCRFRFKCML